MQRIVIITLIIATSTLTTASASFRTKWLNNTLPSSVFLYSNRQLVNSSQVYGSGNLFFLETRRPIDSPDHLLACNFSLIHPNDSDVIYETSHNVAAIADDKALLTLSSGCNHRLYILHFSDCTAIPVIYKHDTLIQYCSWGTIIQSPHADRVDVLFEGNVENNTLEQILRRFTIDFEGNVVDEVLQWFTYLKINDYNGFLYSPNKGRLAAILEADPDLEDWTVKILGIDDNGFNHTIKEYALYNTGMRASDTNELLTACMTTTSTVLTCVQFNASGDMIFEIQILDLIDEDTTMEEIYNLPTGKFNVITSKCLYETEGYCPYKKTEVTVTKINQMGSIVRSMKLPSFDCDFSSRLFEHIHFFEAETEESCFTQICFLGTNIYHRTTCFEK